MGTINVSDASNDSTPAEDVTARPIKRQARSDKDLSVGISLAPKGFDGTWRSRSRDLTDELPRLVAALNMQGIPVFRVSYHLGSWDPAPHKLAVDGRVIRLGGFHTMRPDQLSTVDIYGSHRTVLYVVPASTDASRKRSPKPRAPQEMR